ncbi:MAG: MarR family transcriptional regulator [Chromatiales bacterium]|nr:MAG: MarR family transcriptional regulator [Chromatiales bacterium]
MQERTPAASLKADELLAALWRFLHLAVHRYRGGLTGEALMVLTIMILDRAGRYPTVSELGSFLQLPKSTVSRYVANQIGVGHLEEVIDPNDRRRRLLQPTDAGRQELDWITEQISDVAALVGSDRQDLYTTIVAAARDCD